MTGPSRLAWLGLVLLAGLSYFQYPGRRYLESDTQIYAPMFERFRDPGLLERDPMVTRAHTAFSLYDELAMAAARVTGLDFEPSLGLLHVAVRVALLAGIFLMARAMGLSELLAFACAGVYALGGSVAGPSVLLVEYEPVPRAFALAPVLLAIGFMGQNRPLAASLAASLGFLLHPTTAAPFWTIFVILLFVPDDPGEMKRRLWGLVPLAAAMLALKLAASHQAGLTERQAFLASIDPGWEQLVRLRAPYVWVSLWPRLYFWQYGLMLVAAGAAYWRLRRFLQPGLRFFLLGLCGLGLASLPVSYLLLEKVKWAMMPQAQPLRTILFLQLFTLLLALVMAFELACREGRPDAALWWAAVALAIGVQPRLLFVLLPPALSWLSGSRWRWAGLPAAAAVAWGRPFGLVIWRGDPRRDLFLVLALGLAFALAAALYTRSARRGGVAVVMVVLAAFFAVPGEWRLLSSSRPRNPDLEALAAWARAHTDPAAVFLFADAGRSLEPGVFRARSARALYVDWKGGGQVNFFREYSRQWWQRWQQTLAEPFRPEAMREYRRLGIDYIVISPRDRFPGPPPVFENPRYLVYAVH